MAPTRRIPPAAAGPVDVHAITAKNLGSVRSTAMTPQRADGILPRPCGRRPPPPIGRQHGAALVGAAPRLVRRERGGPPHPRRRASLRLAPARTGDVAPRPSVRRGLHVQIGPLIAIRSARSAKSGVVAIVGRRAGVNQPPSTIAATVPTTGMNESANRKDRSENGR